MTNVNFLFLCFSILIIWLSYLTQPLDIINPPYIQDEYKHQQLLNTNIIQDKGIAVQENPRINDHNAIEEYMQELSTLNVSLEALRLSLNGEVGNKIKKDFCDRWYHSHSVKNRARCYQINSFHLYTYSLLESHYWVFFRISPNQARTQKKLPKQKKADLLIPNVLDQIIQNYRKSIIGNKQESYIIENQRSQKSKELFILLNRPVFLFFIGISDEKRNFFENNLSQIIIMIENDILLMCLHNNWRVDLITTEFLRIGIKKLIVCEMLGLECRVGVGADLKLVYLHEEDEITYLKDKSSLHLLLYYALYENITVLLTVQLL